MDVAEFRQALLAADVAPNGNVQQIIRHVHVSQNSYTNGNK